VSETPATALRRQIVIARHELAENLAVSWPGAPASLFAPEVECRYRYRATLHRVDREHDVARRDQHHSLPQDLQGPMRKVLTRQSIPRRSCRSRAGETH
jgi:hypothetical protein